MSPRGPLQPWEQHVRNTAQALPYPPTPDLARAATGRLRGEQSKPASHGRVLSSRLKAGIVSILLFVVSLLAVPDVRATLGSWLRLGAVEIVFPTPTLPTVPAEQPIIVPTALPGLASTVIPPPAPKTAPTSTPATRPTATSLASVLDLTGETTLDEARKRVQFPVKVPIYPEALGPPDRVFIQEFDGPVVVLVWTEPGAGDQVRMSLHILGVDVFARKFVEHYTQVAETTVHSSRALWVVGPHMLNFYERKSGRSGGRRVVGHVLIWEDKGITYRLETELPLEEAVRIAESAK
jgi:hypothetical protein